MQFLKFIFISLIMFGPISSIAETICVIKNKATGAEAKMVKTTESGASVFRINFESTLSTIFFFQDGRYQFHYDSFYKTTKVKCDKDFHYEQFRSSLGEYSIECRIDKSGPECENRGLSSYHFKPDWQETEPIRTDVKSAVMITHSSYEWDENEKSKSGMILLLDQLKQFPGLPVFILDTNNERIDRHFALPGQFDFYVKSTGGAHAISMPHSQRLIFAGGNLTQCLCETFRDVIRNSQPSEHLVKELIFIKDATYLWIEDYSKGYKRGVPGLASDIFSTKNKQQVLQWFGQDIWGTNDRWGVERKFKLCPTQNSNNTGLIPNAEFVAEIYDRSAGDSTEKFIGTVGSGKIRLRFIFIDSQLLSQYIDPIYKKSGFPPSVYKQNGELIRSRIKK